MQTCAQLKDRAGQLVKSISALEAEQYGLQRTRENLEKNLVEYRQRNLELGEQLDLVTNAVTILSQVSDATVAESYQFIQDSLNNALSRVFEKSTRQIRLREYTRGGIYPQLEVELITEGGVSRSLKDDSGHGISQIISLLCILSLIVITGQRRLLVLDEMLSGLSANAARIVSDILWAFTDVGFQFVISEHGLVVRGSHVYLLESKAGISGIRDHYVEPTGVYLDGGLENRVKKARHIKSGGVQEVSEDLLGDEDTESTKSEANNTQSSATMVGGVKI